MTLEAPTASSESRVVAPRRHERAPLSSASEASIALLLRLSFDRDEIAELLGRMSAEADTETLSLGSQYRRLVKLVRQEDQSARTLDSALAVRLEDKARPLRTYPLVTLATLWAQERDQAGGINGAAMLWTVARQSKPCWRKLEAVMVEDLNYLAARALVTHKESTPPPNMGRGQGEKKSHEQAA